MVRADTRYARSCILITLSFSYSHFADSSRLTYQTKTVPHNPRITPGLRAVLTHPLKDASIRPDEWQWRGAGQPALGRGWPQKEGDTR